MIGVSIIPDTNCTNDDLKPVEKGKWIDLVANFKPTSNQDGYFRYLIDGEKVLDYTGQTSGDCPFGYFLKAGIYNAPKGSIVYNDAFMIIKTPHTRK